MFPSHIRKSDGFIQENEDHLRETGKLSENFAQRLGLGLMGKAVGLTHDWGKQTLTFKTYLEESCGVHGLKRQEEASAKRGTIDHATAGAQLIWDHLKNSGLKIGKPLGQTLANIVMSHHSREGMKDFISPDGNSPFQNRLQKPEEETRKEEASRNTSLDLREEIASLLNEPSVMGEYTNLLQKVQTLDKPRQLRLNHMSTAQRLLFSCLLDADRSGTGKFEKPHLHPETSTIRIPDWAELARRLQSHLSGIIPTKEIDLVRKRISEECSAAAGSPRGRFTLTVPTGGGKTLASLLFGILHALKSQTDENPIERIIYVIPFTSIIEQNATVAKKILGTENVLEHHSNILPEDDTWQNQLLSENWDAPVIFTTSVQLLNALFAAPTSSARRMHRLANSVMIFDEVQTLPIKTIHLFNNSINFLTELMGATAVFCTATQPLIGEVNIEKGCAKIDCRNEIVKDTGRLFQELQRTTIIDHTRNKKWSLEETGKFAQELMESHQSLLLIVNTQKSAKKLYQLLENTTDTLVIHLSTRMCPAHRRDKIQELRSALDPSNPKKVLCVSTPLIEAGVDLDFRTVIRSLAGLDAIAQAAGRCNRNGLNKNGDVWILNIHEENIGWLPEIVEAQRCASRILRELREDESKEPITSPGIIRRYYKYYFFERQHEMDYPLCPQNNPGLLTKTSILDLLSLNGSSSENTAGIKNPEDLPLKQAFSTAATHFKVIESPTETVIVPYTDRALEISEGLKDLLSSDLTEDLSGKTRLLREAQQFTVSVFPDKIQKMLKSGRLQKIHPKVEVYLADKKHYNPSLGLLE